MNNRTKLDVITQSFCVIASKAVGLYVSGVDIMFDDSGKPTLIEVNSNFVWKTQKITGVNIAKHIIEYVIMKSEIKPKDIDNQSIYEVFEENEYLHDSYLFKKNSTIGDEYSEKAMDIFDRMLKSQGDKSKLLEMLHTLDA